MNLKAGQYIKHSKYGTGTILERDEERTTVDFDTAGVRKFVTSIASFEIAEGEAPIKKKRSSKKRVKAAAAATVVV